MPYLIIFLFLLPLSVVAQEQNPPQRWSYGAYFATEIGAFGRGSSERFPGSSTQFGVEAYYRFHRFVEVGLQVGHHREFVERTRILLDLPDPFPPPFLGQQGGLFAGVQTRLNYRIGQGDLSVTGSIGAIRNQYRFEVAFYEAENQVEFYSNRRLFGYLQFSLGYAYWVHQNVAVQFSATTTDIEYALNSNTTWDVRSNGSLGGTVSDQLVALLIPDPAALDLFRTTQNSIHLRLSFLYRPQ